MFFFCHEVLAFRSAEQICNVDSSLFANEVVGDEDSCDRSQDSTVSVHPGEVCTAGTVDPPCLQDEERIEEKHNLGSPADNEKAFRQQAENEMVSLIAYMAEKEQ